MFKISSKINAIAEIAENAMHLQKGDLEADVLFALIFRLANKCETRAEGLENLYHESQNRVLELQKKVIQLSTESAIVALEQNVTSSGSEDNVEDDMPF